MGLSSYPSKNPGREYILADRTKCNRAHVQIGDGSSVTSGRHAYLLGWERQTAGDVSTLGLGLRSAPVGPKRPSPGRAGPTPVSQCLTQTRKAGYSRIGETLLSRLLSLCKTFVSLSRERARTAFLAHRARCGSRECRSLTKITRCLPPQFVRMPENG